MDIRLQQLSHVYHAGTPLEVAALFDVDLSIPQGSYMALIGHTGSGKSTLLQHLNVLLKPTSGSLWLGDMEVTAQSKNKDLKHLRQRIGTVFQFPEAQLFEETVEKDVAFGPQNYGMDEEEALDVARQTLSLVGVDESLFQASPFELSGGQQRRVAIAGVLALQPEVLILDEPTAGLDPKGQKELMGLFADLHHRHHMTVILATHQMEDVAAYADQLAILEKGRLIKTGRPQDIFQQVDWLQSKQLDVPPAVHFARSLGQKEGWQDSPLPIKLDDLADWIVQQVKGGED